MKKYGMMQNVFDLIWWGEQGDLLVEVRHRVFLGGKADGVIFHTSLTDKDGPAVLFASEIVALMKAVVKADGRGDRCVSPEGDRGKRCGRRTWKDSFPVLCYYDTIR